MSEVGTLLLVCICVGGKIKLTPELWSLLLLLKAPNQGSVNPDTCWIQQQCHQEATQFINEADHTPSDICPSPMCMMNQRIGKIWSIVPRLFGNMNLACVWWFLSIWNLVIISDSSPSQRSEARVEKTLEALSNILNRESLRFVLYRLAVIHRTAFQKSHGISFFFPSSLPARWSQILQILVACWDTTSTVCFTEKSSSPKKK